MRRVAAQADRHHLVQELHRVGEGVLVEAAPGRLVERVGVHVVRGHFGRRAVLLQRFVQPGRIEEMLADEDVAGRCPGRARKAPGQLAGGGHRLRVAPALLQRVGEEEQRLVQAGSPRILLQELPVPRDRFGSGAGGGAAVARGRSLVALVGRGLGADAQGKAARAQQAGEPRHHLRLFRGRAAQLQHAPERGLLLLLPGGHDRPRAAVQQRRIAPGLGHGSGDEQRDHPGPSLSERGQAAPLRLQPCNLRSRTSPLAGGGNREAVL